MESGYDVNRLLNLPTISNKEIEILSSDGSNKIISAPIYVAPPPVGNIQTDRGEEISTSRLSNTYTNVSQIQLDNETEIYFPAVCLVPLRLYKADSVYLLAQNGDGFSTHSSAEPLALSVLSPNFNNSDTSGSAVDTTLSISGSFTSCIDSSLNRLYNEGNGKDISSLSDNINNTLSSSSFDELTRFQILNAPLDCVWTTNEVTNNSSLYSTNNTSSFEETSSGEESYMHFSVINETSAIAETLFPLLLQSQTPENDSNEISPRDSKENVSYLNLIRATNVQEFAPHTSSANSETYNTEAMPANYCSNYSFQAENGSAAAKPLFCKFCYKNKEPAYIYNSHQLKSENGITICPILRNYICPICGNSGDFAHTIKYCPENPENILYKQQIQLPPPVYFNNIAPTSISPYISGASANDPQHIYNEQMQMQTVSSIPHACSSYNSIRSTSPTTTYYDRFSCAFPSANTFKRKKKICKFCRRNKEPALIYNSHRLRDEAGRINCPYLRQFVCRLCGATGDNAHTRKYCPKNTYEAFIRKVMCQ